MSFNYFISDEVFQYIVDAVNLIAEHGYKLVPQYHFIPASGLWRHRDGVVEPPLRLSQVEFDGDGMSIPRRNDRAPEAALAGYLAEARVLLDSLPEPVHVADADLGADFDHLRWFELPQESLAGSRAPA